MDGSSENVTKESEDETLTSNENSVTNNDINNAESTTEETTVNQEEIMVAKQDTTIQEETYSIQEFIDNSKALGYKKEVVAGALFNCKKIDLTKDEFEETIKNFLGKKVE